VHEKFGEDGELVDEQTKVLLPRNLEAFADWAEKNSA